MSLMGRAFKGLGDAAQQIGDRYLDTSAQQERAQFLSDLQMKNAQAMDEYQLSDARQTKLRDAAAATERQVGSARNEVALAGRRAEATDPDLMMADVDRAGRVARATADATADASAASVVKNGNDPQYLRATKLLTAAQRQPESAGSLAAAALAKEQLATLQSTNALKTELQKAVAIGDKAGEEDLRAQLDVLQDKGSKSEKYAALVEKALNSNAGALKIISDPLSDPAARRAAEDEVQRNNRLIEQFASKAGLTMDKPKLPESDAHAQAEAAIKAGAKPEEVNRRLKEQGYAPIGQPVPRKGLMDQARDLIMDQARESVKPTPSEAQGLERLTPRAAQAGFTARMGQSGTMFQRNGTGPLYTPAEVAKELGVAW